MENDKLLPALPRIIVCMLSTPFRPRFVLFCYILWTPLRLTCLNVYYGCNSFSKSNHDGEEEEDVRSEYLTDELSGRQQHQLTSPRNAQCLCLEQSGFHGARKISELNSLLFPPWKVFKAAASPLLEES